MTVERDARPPGNRRYSRLARVNEALREVLADELERINDEALELVTLTGVKVSPDLRHATVWFSALARTALLARTQAGSTNDVVADVSASLAGHRVRLQAAVGRQLRLKHTPALVFEDDPAIGAGSRVEDVLRGIHHGNEEEQEGSSP